ncbi:MAG: type II toxin-antitoxin system Phd/YefM family antitoxin [Chloroflexota bacterium]|nr:type II toxin-antitoxin system Phd/YefM family antitoxin [Chloroflexota bacterium]
MAPVNIHEAKTHLSRLLARVALGEEITIAKAGRPVAKLIGIRPRASRRPLGTAKGRVNISADFDAPLPKDLRRALGE